MLAQALGCANATHCPPARYSQPLPHLYQLLEDYLKACHKKPATLKNTKNHISRLFRMATARGLFSLPPAVPEARFDAAARPIRPRSRNNGSYLTFKYWPAPLREAWEAFERWATAPIVAGRKAQWRKRQITVDSYQMHLQPFFGYIYHVRKIADPSFEHLFDYDLIQGFAYWHVNDHHKEAVITTHIFLNALLVLTNQYRPLPELRSRIKELKRNLPNPSPLFDKNDAWVSSDELARIGQAIWPKQRSVSWTTTYQRQYQVGTVYGARAGASLILQLWKYIPFRVRNIQELQLDTNLYKDTSGTWKIRFAHEQLKVAQKRGRPNIFEVSFPPALTQVLEDYLTTWRPFLAQASGHRYRHLYLDKFGEPYCRATLYCRLRRTVYRFTGKHWHPHIVRTVWATEWIRETGDFFTAAIMLNDTLEMVIRRYTHLLDENVAEKAYERISQRT
jgi:hypothetical protein